MRRRLLLLPLAAIFFACVFQLITTQPPLATYPATYSLATQTLSVEMAYATSQTDRVYQRSRFVDLKTGDILTWNELEPVQTGIMFHDVVSQHPVDPSPDYCGLAAVEDSAGVLQRVPFRFPAYPTLLDERYLVGFNKRSIYAFDLRSDSVTQSVELSKSDTAGWIIPLNSIPGVFVVMSATSNVPPVKYTATVFRMQDANLEELFAIPGASYDIYGVDGKLLFWEEQQRSFIEYSLQGDPIGPFELSDEISSRLRDSPSSTLNTDNGLITLSDTSRSPAVYEYFDLNSRLNVDLPSDRLVRRVPGELYNANVAVFFQPGVPNSVDEEKLIGFDLSQNKVLWNREIETEFVEWGLFENSVLLVDRRFGLTVELINSKTGETERSIQPFWAMVLITPTLCLSGIGFAAIWSSTSPGRPIIQSVGLSKPIVNVAFFSGVLLTCFAAYLRYWHMLPGYPSLAAFNYSHGMFVGLTLASLTWLALGRKRIILRAMPTLLILSGLLAFASWCFAVDKIIAGEALSSTLIPSSIAAFCLLAFRVLGFQWVHIKQSPHTLNEGEPTKSHDEDSKMPLRDLFIAATGFAVLFAALRPVANSIGVPDVTQLIVSITVYFVSLCIFFTFVTQSANRWLARAGVCVALLLLTALCVENLFQFTTARPLLGFEHFGEELVFLRVATTGALCLFGILFLFRCDGWRFHRGVAS